MSDHEHDELLELAASALRERTSGASDRAKETRARVLAAHSRSSSQRTWAAAAALLLAFALGAPTVWAWSTGRLDALFGAEPPAESSSEEPSVETPERARREPMAEEETLAPPEAMEPEPELTPPLEEDAIAPPAPPIDEPEIVARGEQVDAPDVDPAERRAYREAHDLHFEAHDPAGALGGWDRYLARYPRGRFALEARYNRALCLVRLGRADEARDALAPFAAGLHGGYRRTEASALIEAMDAP